MRQSDHVSRGFAVPAVNKGTPAHANPTIARFLQTSARYLAASAARSVQPGQHQDVDHLPAAQRRAVEASRYRSMGNNGES